jgi:hypothetical protein
LRNFITDLLGDISPDSNPGSKIVFHRPVHHC